MVFDTETEKGYILPLEALTLDEPARQKFAAWQASGEVGYFIINLAGGFSVEG